MAGIVRQTPSNPFARGGILAVAAAVTFGATTPVVKRLGMNVGPFPTAMLLYAGAALASVRGFGPRRSHEASLRPQNALRVLAVALAGALFAPACLAWGLQHTSGASASLLLNFEAAFTVLLGWRLYHEHLGRRIVLALTLMLAGGACLVARTANLPARSRVGSVRRRACRAGVGGGQRADSPTRRLRSHRRREMEERPRRDLGVVRSRSS